MIRGKLFLVVSDQDEREFLLEKETVTLGRASDNDIVLPSPKVSRHHARLIFLPRSCHRRRWQHPGHLRRRRKDNRQPPSPPRRHYCHSRSPPALRVCTRCRGGRATGSQCGCACPSARPRRRRLSPAEAKPAAVAAPSVAPLSAPAPQVAPQAKRAVAPPEPLFRRIVVVEIAQLPPPTYCARPGHSLLHWHAADPVQPVQPGAKNQ